MSYNVQELVERDQRYVWHPYASTVSPIPAYPVASAAGVRLTLQDGRELIDGMSSWWAAVHGYNHPALNAAAHQQIDTLSHVMFGGLTHAPAVTLCEKLVSMTPAGLNRVFISDSGSVAVEVAIKMAFQYWLSKGTQRRNKLLTLRNGYHGDTFMAMSVCDPVNGMHHLFKDVMQQHVFAPAPPLGFEREFDESDVAELKQLLEAHQGEIAAIILEPIVQGAGGMRFYSPEYLKRIRALCDHYDVLLIADEIATGFGRSGALFACEHAGISPDIMCLGKALTGGYLSLAATLCNDKVANGIADGEAGVLMHGPTFMGNPLACSIANASLDLLESADWKSQVQRIEHGLQRGLAPARDNPNVADVRVLGAIGVVERKEPVDMAEITPKFVERGVWVRPFGKLVYVMPPYIMNDDDLTSLCRAVVEVV